ncbi:MAG: hypothetical protein HY360_22735 [Verrucomicrobia bacterium]|nr:hypothetical protein [Verrucomicrobiota bacterium]
MKLIFPGLITWNILLFAAAITTGIEGWRIWHFSLGVFTGIFICLTHSLVFIHLIGSGKGVQEAVETHSLPNDPETGYVQRSRSYKKRAFPWAVSAPLAAMAVIWAGGWHDTNRFAAPEWLDVSHGWHTGLVWIAVGTNLCAFWKEYRVIAENSRLIREVNEIIRAKSLPPGAKL